MYSPSYSDGADGALKWAVVTVEGNDIDNIERVWMEQGRTVTRGGRLEQIIHEKLELWGKLLSTIKSHVDQELDDRGRSCSGTHGWVRWKELQWIRGQRSSGSSWGLLRPWERAVHGRPQD